MKRGQNESVDSSVDSYYNRFQELLEDLNEADDKISTSSAMRQFIFTLGNDFKPIQNLYWIVNNIMVMDRIRIGLTIQKMD